MYQLTAVDWAWIGGFLLLSLVVGLGFTRRSSRSLAEYFTAGKSTPWWILGTSIAATTFSVDTPLVVAALVLKEGIAGNWYWWSVAPSGMLGVFFFAGLWQRSGCLTQAEFAVIRYGPSRAKTLRLFYVFYHGVLRNAATLGFVNLAMAEVITLCTSFDRWEALLVCFVINVVYTSLGGVLGVLWTDFFQFLLAMAVTVIIAYYATVAAGGLDDLRAIAASPWQFATLPSVDGSYVPDAGTSQFRSFLIYVTLFWIACTATDCNGYAVQRLLCAKDERHAVWGYLWFNFAHYVLRSWPWILVGLASVKFFLPLSDPGDAEKVYVFTILQKIPSWLIGPALVALLAAYMSTVNTHLNWGASYLINDYYKPYVRPGELDAHYVYAGKIATVLIALVGLAVTWYMHSIQQGWDIVFGLLSGMGVVGILRWLWWRISAWTELGCMIGAGLATGAVQMLQGHYPQLVVPFSFLVIVPVSLIGAAIGTFAFAPEPRDVLVAFARRVRPPGPGWRNIPTIATHLEPAPHAGGGLGRATICWLMGTAAIYCALFGIGDVLLKSRIRGMGLCVAALLLALIVGFIYRPDWLAAARRGKRGD